MRVDTILPLRDKLNASNSEGTAVMLTTLAAYSASGGNC